jgi:hypothetical protein
LNHLSIRYATKFILSTINTCPNQQSTILLLKSNSTTYIPPNHNKVELDLNQNTIHLNTNKRLFRQPGKTKVKLLKFKANHFNGINLIRSKKTINWPNSSNPNLQPPNISSNTLSHKESNVSAITRTHKYQSENNITITIANKENKWL